MKSIWKDKGNEKFQYFCPLCRANRAIAFHPNPNRLLQVARVMATTLFVTLCLWPWFELKGLVSFVPLWATFELIYRTKVRVSVQCDECGFDPFLTLVDAKKARYELREVWKRRLEERGLSYPERGRPKVSRSDYLRGKQAPPASSAPTEQDPSDSV